MTIVWPSPLGQLVNVLFTVTILKTTLKKGAIMAVHNHS